MRGRLTVTIAALLIWLAHQNAHAAEDKERSNADYVLFLLTVARDQLRTHDDLLVMYESDPERYWQLAPHLNELRGEILERALSAYYLYGPQYMTDEAVALRELLFVKRGQPTWQQFPPALDDLVTFNYLSHLPQSPYPDAGVTAEEAELLPAGTILYKPIPAHPAYLLSKSGGLEFYFLAIIGDGKRGMNPDVVEALFNGDIHCAVDVIPSGIVWFDGFYPDRTEQGTNVVGGQAVPLPED
jgi:hypothetical protein